MMVIYEKIYKKHGLSKTQQEIVDLVGFNKTVLEIGSSSGYMTNFFLKNNCDVDIIEANKNVFSKLPKGIRKALNYSIEDDSVYKHLDKNYNFIILADVLEHLVNPDKTLKMLKQVASNKTQLIISMPNIASWSMRKQLFFNGDFEYTNSGILDKTHLHFYTPNTLPKLLINNDWIVQSIKGTITRLPFEGVLSKLPIIGLVFKMFFYKKIVLKFPNLAYSHFYVTALKK